MPPPPVPGSLPPAAISPMVTSPSTAAGLIGASPAAASIAINGAALPTGVSNGIAPGMYPYNQVPTVLTQPGQQPGQPAAQQPALVPVSGGQVPQVGANHSVGLTHLNPRSGVVAAAAGAYPMYPQPVLYWYPSPPVSPQSAGYYMHSCPTTVAVKGLPYTTQIPELLAFLDGIYEVRGHLRNPRDWGLSLKL